ncbi:hypothetical protein [Streptomyces sp. NPDC014734]|uniref:hypothetical protein n=1 Tax=Streptomyces sp. NPDC014734 TaxID=3364886 RepID=UPI0036F7680C
MTTAETAGANGTGRAEGTSWGAPLPQPTSARPRVLDSLLWAVLIPLVTVVSTVLGLYLWFWAGVVLMMVAAATAAIMAGGIWHRAGAAVVATATTMALGFFAGPTLHEAYLKRFGDRADALVVDTSRTVNPKGTETDLCRVVDTSGTVQDLDETQNCYGQFEPGQHVVLFKDPVGGLKPWIEASNDRSPDVVSLSATGGLFATTVATLLHAGIRRRSGREQDARKLRAYGPPRRSEP